MSFLTNIDHELFFFINHKCHFDALNKLMPYWRSMYLWIPLYVFFTAFLIEKFGKKGGIYILFLAATIGVGDTISSKIIKKTVQRIRPCTELKSEVKLLIPCGSGYSFPSSHATNHFAIATFIILTFAADKKWFKRGLLIWASTIALGQVYVGVHYPIDIICGGLLGSLIGWEIAILYKKYFSQYQIDCQ